MTYIFLIAYLTATFGIHGGEGITGINRQIRNLLCAIPFGLVAYIITSTHYDYPVALIFFMLAYIGVNLGFKDINGQPNYAWLPIKGFVTLPIGGIFLLPIAYKIGYDTSLKNVLAEYLSGTLYGIILATALYLK